MSRTLAYICAPFAAPTDEERRANVAVAMAMSRAALEAGRTPVVIHATIEAGGMGRDDVPEERRRGLEAAVSLAEAVAIGWGELWVCTARNGGLSTGMVYEVVAFVKAHPQTVIHEVPMGRVGSASDWLSGKVPALTMVSRLESRWRVPRDG